MSLRWRVQLLVTALLLAFTAAFALLQIAGTRVSVREEINGATQVATRLLARIASAYEPAGPAGMQAFLQQLGRVRANDLFLYDGLGRELYRSPPSTYKAGRAAPAWYDRLVAPRLETRAIAVGAGRLVIRPDASRAVLDGFDELGRALALALLGFMFANLLLLPLTAHVLRPLEQVVDGLNAMERGHYGVRLPQLPTRELERIGQSFNRMAAAVAGSAEAREAEARARAELAENRALTGIIQKRIEQERGAIARELHDELGQQITAIKSLGLSIARRTAPSDAPSEQAARLVMGIADRIYEVVHLLVRRLRPLALDRFGLADALDDLVSDWRAQNPAIRFDVRITALPERLPEPVATAAYRIVQEAVNNAIRHADAKAVRIVVEAAGGSAGIPAADGPALAITLSDDGDGLPAGWERKGHFGLLGMQERAELIGGTLRIGVGAAGGVEVSARLPIDVGRADPEPEHA